ncbi:MAG: hypothetical protein V4527_09390 [Pseudomonadota bacterium]
MREIALRTANGWLEKGQKTERFRDNSGCKTGSGGLGKLEP